MVVAPLVLAGCAGSDGEYPSLAIRDVERRARTYTPPPPLTPAPQIAEVLARVSALRNAANGAHGQFMAAVPVARVAARRARGVSRASTAWSNAQIAIADLESLRSRTGVPLADLDRLYVDSTIAFTQRTAIGAARDEVINLVAQEDRILAELGSIVGP
ncbi:MAG: hypothetical protein WA948_05275 [Pontixanthobacter sp.]